MVAKTSGGNIGLGHLPAIIRGPRSAEFLRESDEKPFRAADVAEAIDVLVLHDLADKLRAALSKSLERIVDVINREHDAQVPCCVDRGVSVIRHDRRSDKARELKPAVTIRRAHHGHFDALIAQSSHTPGPFSFDRGPPFELEAELLKEFNRCREVVNDDPHVVHSFDCHGLSLFPNFV